MFAYELVTRVTLGALQSYSPIFSRRIPPCTVQDTAPKPAQTRAADPCSNVDLRRTTGQGDQVCERKEPTKLRTYE